MAPYCWSAVPLDKSHEIYAFPTVKNCSGGDFRTCPECEGTDDNEDGCIDVCNTCHVVFCGCNSCLINHGCTDWTMVYMVVVGFGADGVISRLDRKIQRADYLHLSREHRGSYLLSCMRCRWTRFFKLGNDTLFTDVESSMFATEELYDEFKRLYGAEKCLKKSA